MLVTVLTPTLNAARYFPECLRSLHAQTWPREGLEHYVLDGVSSDATVALARAAGARVEVAKDSGIYEAMNRGVARAKGDVIGWLNADDTLKPDAVERVARKFQADPALEIVVGDWEMAYPGRTRTRRARADALERIRAGATSEQWVFPIGVWFRADALRRIGPYDARYRIAADLELWIRAAALDPLPRMAHAGGVLGSFRVHPSSLSSGSSPTRSLEEGIDFLTRWASDPAAPAGVRRYALHVLRRYRFELSMWNDRNAPTLRRITGAWKEIRTLGQLGPGAAWDVRWDLKDLAYLIAARAVGWKGLGA